MKRAAGFTLIELLVAISILAIVAVLGWRGLDGIVRARVALTEQLEATRGMQLAFAQMQSDCEHLADPSGLQGRAYLLAEKDRMTMVRNTYNENEPARLQVVSYRIVGGMLTRRESAGTRDLIQLDVLWKAATSDIDPAVPVTLQAGVLGMQVMTWENNGWRQGGVSGTTVNPALLQGQGQGQGQPPPALPPAPTGLQVDLSVQVQGVQSVMSKSFLLGGM